jgi:hypothetical protein
LLSARIMDDIFRQIDPRVGGGPDRSQAKPPVPSLSPLPR